MHLDSRHKPIPVAAGMKGISEFVTQVVKGLNAWPGTDKNDFIPEKIIRHVARLQRLAITGMRSLQWRTIVTDPVLARVPQRQGFADGQSKPAGGCPGQAG